MLNKLFKAYPPFISAMAKNWLNYIYANLGNSIHQITWYLKNNLLKILRIASTIYHSIETYPNKRQWVTPISNLALFACK